METDRTGPRYRDTGALEHAPTPATTETSPQIIEEVRSTSGQRYHCPSLPGGDVVDYDADNPPPPLDDRSGRGVT